MPADRKSFDPRNLWSKAIRITLWCTHPGEWHPVPEASYETSLPKDWFVRALPYLKTTLRVLQFAPVIASTVPGASEIRDHLQMLHAICKSIEEELSRTGTRAAMDNDARLWGTERSEGPLEREVKKLLLKLGESNSFAPLHKVITPIGAVAWVCPVHFELYHSKPRTVDGGGCEAGKGKAPSNTEPKPAPAMRFLSVVDSKPSQEGTQSRAPSRADEVRVFVDTTIVKNTHDQWFCPGAGKYEWFKDQADAPEMVVVPSGSFMMGSPGDDERSRPQHSVTIPSPFAAGRFPVTFDEWDSYAADVGFKSESLDQGSGGRGRRPVINVSWWDAVDYVEWLSRKTAKTYRLLTEAEREYVTRAGTATRFWWGSRISTQYANYDGNCSTHAHPSKGEFRGCTLPVDSFQPNPWGLYQVHGNIFEWCQDCYHFGYVGAPSDGSAWISGECTHRIVRGGSWAVNPDSLWAFVRAGMEPDERDDRTGFRVARTLSP